MSGRQNSIKKLLELKFRQKEDSKDRILEALKNGEKTVYELCDPAQLRQTRRLLKELEEEERIFKKKQIGKGNKTLYCLKENS